MKVNIISKSISKKNKNRLKRKMRIRNKIATSENMPRMSFFRSNKHLSVQVISDVQGTTLATISTYEQKFKSLPPTVETAKTLGEEFGTILQDKKITQVVLDRNGYKYHGVLKAFVEGIREKGIKI